MELSNIFTLIVLNTSNVKKLNYYIIQMSLFYTTLSLINIYFAGLNLNYSGTAFREEKPDMLLVYFQH